MDTEFVKRKIPKQEFDKVDTQNMYRWFWKLPEPISASELNKDEILNKFIKYATQIVENME